MAASSPLDTTELRQIEKTLDEGNTQEAATRLGQLGDSRDHKEAIDFLTTRLLFQRGRIDLNGAADRLSAILQRVPYFPEAEDWLIELEARTERSALGGGVPAASDTVTTPPPPSQAPSIPRNRADRVHPYFDELGPDDDVTPTESRGRLPDDDAEDLFPNSSEPPPRPNAMTAADVMGSEPPTRPDVSRSNITDPEPPTRPNLPRAQPLRTEPPLRSDGSRGDATGAPTRPSHMPFDNLRAKEQLSASAGRYRGGSDDPGEVIGRGRRSRGPAPRASQQVPPNLERCIRDAFVLFEAGQLEEARSLLPEGDVPKDLPPELRTLLARVLLELGQAERAALQATLALEQAPHAVETQLIFVWSAVRYARQRDDAWSLERAGRILKDLHQNPALAADLVDALTSSVEARVGVPAVALRLAQRALRVNADSIDGLAALAEAAALAGEERRAEAALERLYAVSETAAEEIAPRLRRMGVGEHGPTSSASVWSPLEHTLSSGARDAALAGLEALAEETLAELAIEALDQTEASARAAARFFALGPVFRHFGAFDLSLKSIERLEVGLGLLYGSGPRPLEVPGVSSALWRLAGIYLGETLRQCCDGKWRTDSELLKDTRLDLLGVEVEPFQLVRHRIAHGRRATLKAALEELLGRAPSSAHAHRAALAEAPPLPWGDDAWPELDALPRLGRAVCHSVIAVYASELLQVRLDRGPQSLEALDRYVQLIAPASAPLDADSAWARWLSVFLGAYLGEVLRSEFGGAWVDGVGSGAEAFEVECGEQRVAPLAVVRDAICGQRTSCLAELVEELRGEPLGR